MEMQQFGEQYFEEPLPEFKIGEPVEDLQGNRGKVVELNNDHMHPNTLRVQFEGEELAHICRMDQLKKIEQN
ncbi:MAG: hypothetical protein COY66_02860 [Candidatus Kerfeldbacteria bacterium CG_4_10_14_0_8_um_filter_42_10]|uniref:KOW domain-containing protein n=1 Tax=Candidatus Kerfeldbacteria bacterium CG_4_10_14_0_8_um_filter_42_10 TaxID=2014248 RepID=A0A2M7RJC1_9BACT|nr:MAG: hypothetical protein COY66_02860 [Candidatus Kerfeldbacteria bacterium CG_4_10_14_0_8_um_filter_42_10]